MSEQIKNKLQQFEATPPPGLWDRIALNLDETSLYKDTSERLFNYEATPPAGVFDKVITALERDLPQKEVPVRKINPGFRRWSVAAAVLIVLSTLGILLYSNSGKDQNLAATAPKTNVPLIHRQQITNNPPIVETDEASNDDDTKSIKHLALNKLLHSVRPSNVQNKNTEPADVDFVSSKPTVQITTSNIKESLSELASKFVLNGNYITVLGPNGELRKISLKLYNAMHGHTFATNPEASNQNMVWEKRLSDWRTKVVQSGYAPNAINGMDILDLKELIREN